MNLLLGIFFVVVFSIMNRARGSRIFNLVKSTTEGRLASMAVCALATTLVLALTSSALPIPLYQIFFVLWGLLYGWTVPAWDAYWGAAIGSNSPHSKAWGIGMMTLRNLLLLPFYGFVTYLSGDWSHLIFSASILLMGLVYYVWGLVIKDGAVIQDSELTNGAIIGMTTWAIIGL